MNSLATIDSSLTDQIRYLSQVSTGQPHEGSSYASQKVLQMAWHRLANAKTRVSELERLKGQHASRLISPAQRQALIQQQQDNQEQRRQMELKMKEQVKQQDGDDSRMDDVKDEIKQEVSDIKKEPEMMDQSGSGSTTDAASADHKPPTDDHDLMSSSGATGASSFDPSSSSGGGGTGGQ
eukprot:TRINITY_DN16554_c0_g1_i3.p1 TRINITY_DN16554_c0_g1~~TRINITY_DN16554_c0_g1_i3.p1  ORF type:complete len:180 (+),score=41.94 TRINITY_DN16554_c0_g1_i3:299-838(+)